MFFLTQDRYIFLHYCDVQFNSRSIKKEERTGPGKRRHVLADTLLLMIFLGLRKLGSICCGDKMFLNKIRNNFCLGHKICVHNKCCVRGQTGKHLCRQQCVLVCQGLKAWVYWIYCCSADWALRHVSCQCHLSYKRATD